MTCLEFATRIIWAELDMTVERTFERNHGDRKGIFPVPIEKWEAHGTPMRIISRPRPSRVPLPEENALISHNAKAPSRN